MSARPAAAVLGKPIAHSLSPVLHQAAYAALGLDWDYLAFEVDEAGLPAFLAARETGWVGFSLTMPLKRAAFHLAVETDAAAKATRACNTLLPVAGGWSGRNTDVPGAVAALRAAGIQSLAKVSVLGAGATAASVMAAAIELGAIEFWVHARRPAAVADLAALFPEVSVGSADLAAEVAGCDLLVNTLPAGVPGPAQLPDEVKAVFDVTYAPWPTALSAAAVAAGRPVVGGLDLLVAQALIQVQLMTGCADASLPALLEVMSAAGRAEQARRSG